MIYALNDRGEKVTATPGATAICPLCSAPLVPKCGQVNVWHWAHVSRDDCDPWYEPETPWHAGWKALVDPLWCEFSLPPHRADIVGNDLTVIELQHSSISPREIAERERFYPKMIWLLDVTDQIMAANGRYRFDLSWQGLGTSRPWVRFTWRWPRRSLLAAKCPLFVDFGSHLLEVKGFRKRRLLRGWGYILKREAFIARFLSSALRTTP